MPNFNSIGSEVLDLHMVENCYLPLTGGIALTTVYALTYYTVTQQMYRQLQYLFECHGNV